MFKKSDVKDIYDLTPMQWGMLFHRMMDNESFAYFEQQVFSVTGSIDTLFFEKAFNKVIEKYDVLRTVFLYKKVETPIQVVLKKREAKIDFKDISGLPENEKNNAVEVMMRQDKETNFDLEKDIPIRVGVIKTAARSYRIIWSHHHIVMDGWCIGIIVNDFFQFYNMLKQGKPLGPESAAPYSRYLKWLKRQDRDEGLSFWRTYLEGFEKKTGLPRLKAAPRPGETRKDKYIIEAYSMLLDKDVGGRLNDIANEKNVTLNNVFQVLWGILLRKYNNTGDVVFGTVVSGRPAEIDDIETMVGLFINTTPLRIGSDMGRTFSGLLEKNQQNVLRARAYEYLPLPDIQAESVLKFDLLDHIMLFENYPLRETVKQAAGAGDPGFVIEDVRSHEQSNYDFNIIIVPGEQIRVHFSFNAGVYEPAFIARVASHLKQAAAQVSRDPDRPVKNIDILTPEEKQQVLYDFNRTETESLQNKTIHELFEEQAERTPGQIAVCAPLPSNREDIVITSRFKKNPFLVERDLESTGKISFTLLKTHRHNSAVVNTNLLKLIGLFDGNADTRSIYSRVKDLEGNEEVPFIIYAPDTMDLLEITHDFRCEADITTGLNFENFIRLVELLYRVYVLEPAAVPAAPAAGVTAEKGLNPLTPRDFDAVELTGSEVNIPLNERVSPKKKKKCSTSDVLLLGDTPGMPSTGLLYIAAFLKRNGVNALCRFHDGSEDFTSMKRDIEELLESVQPKIVAISLKWFLYIARVSDMCKIVKKYSQKTGIPIKVVVGGDTASYYWEEIIKEDGIDYIVLGDGELPLLKICRGEENAGIPNCVYKENGKISRTPVTYLNEKTNSPDIYLSHLDEILLSDNAPLFGTFFIYTHLGCGGNCIYCGGCRQAQRANFNRKGVFTRPVPEVRKDILEALPYTSTFQFDFDTAPGRLEEYCGELWEGIDLSGHFCIVSRPRKPSASLLELAVKTFKYVYWDIDVSTLSERHRMQLESMGVLKPQLTDEEILTFLRRCEPYENTEVRFNLIAGLPLSTLEDIDAGETFLARITAGYPAFSELHWARLHAQPGAPIIEDAQKYNMHSYASTFGDFLEYSRKNFTPQSRHQALDSLAYPYVYFNDDPLNSKISIHYNQTNRKIREYRENKRTGRFPGESLTFAQLNRNADLLARSLKNRGVVPGGIVGLKVTPSPDIPVGILGILKAGCAYLPIDPGTPAERIQYMLKDSNAAVLVSGESELSELGSDLSTRSSHPIHPAQPTQPCYIIYTSGTTGKPKGVVLTHGNLVNYVRWFTRTAELTAGDSALLTSSFAFDLGYTALYPPLLNGAPLHILPKETYLSAEHLLAYIRRHRVTYLKVTPSLFSIVVQSPDFSGETCASLRLVVIGGEPISTVDVANAHRACPHIKFINHYGPTEATIGCIARYIDFHEFEEYEKNPTIGTPIDNTKVLILDKHSNLQPVGIPGELCISGTSLAAGYLNRPDLTNQKFCGGPGGPAARGAYKYKSFGLAKNQEADCSSMPVYRSPMPWDFSKEPLAAGGRFYKTGDRARWMPDGNIEFLGRIDNQIKIRGYRIELEEIENQLLKHNQIEEAAVVTRESKNNDRYICAYYVPGSEKSKEENPTALRLEEIGLETGPHEPAARTIVRHFEEQVEKTPGYTAVTNGRDLSLTYRELNEKSNRAAHIISAKYDDRYALSKRERTRYKRQMLLNGWGIESQEKLKGTTVFVAGAGGGASPTIMQLALAGVGTIIACDYDRVELSNLNRQFLHDESRIGMNKALSAKETILRINPHVTVLPVTDKLTRENVFELVGDSSVIFDMFDGQDDKFILSECAAVKGIPHIISAMTDIGSYTAVFHTPMTPCYHCLFDKNKLEEMVAGMKTMVEEYEKNPLPVSASSLFVSTGFAVNEAVKILLGLKNPAYNKYFFFNQAGSEDAAEAESFRAMTYTYSDHFRRICKEQGFDWDIGWRGNFLEELKIVPDPGCPVCGENSKERPATLEAKSQAQTRTPRPETGAGRDKRRQTAALLTDHDLLLPVGIMGILKSGKNYLHLDPNLARHRQIQLLEDSETRIILTDSGNFKGTKNIRDGFNKNVPIVIIDEIEETVKSENPGNPIEPAENLSHELDAALAPFYAAIVKGETYNPSQQESKSFSLSQLREFLARSLPEYMIPSHFVPLEEMPLTPNGKLDKNALPEPGITVEDNYTAPRDDLERKLAAIWSDVLGIEKEIIGIESNFFQLGGHSLKATVLVSKIHKAFNVKIPLAEIFDTPSVNGISGYIRNAAKEQYTGIEPVEKKDYYPSSSAQKRLYILMQMDLENTAYNMSNLFELEEEAGREKLEDIFSKLIKRHESLRTSFGIVNGEPVQIIQKNVEFEIEYFDLPPGTDRKNPVDDIMRRFVRPFDLSRAPLLRAGLVTQPGKRHLLLVDMHHIISDGVSHNVLAENFTALYSGGQLPPLEIQYKDYAQWQRKEKESGVLKQQETFWLNVFKGDIPAMNLPTDYVRPDVQTFEGKTVGFEINGEDTGKLKELALLEDVTLYMILLALTYVLFSKVCNRQDIVLGTGTAGRSNEALRDVIGMFVNTLALRNFPSGDKTFREFLADVKERTLAAFENQDHQFEDLVEKVAPHRARNRNPLFDVMFAFNISEENPGESPEPRPPETGESPVAFDGGTSTFDIALMVNETQKRLPCIFSYRTKLFKEETIKRFIQYFKDITASVLENKNIKLKDIVISHKTIKADLNVSQDEFDGWDTL